MFFLLRMTFWLGVVCVLLPVGGNAARDKQIDPASAISAASATVSDMAGFCARQPEACKVGGEVAVAIGVKAEAGAKTLYEIVSAKLNEKSADKPAPKAIPASMQGTLTPSDLSPSFHAPAAVPLPPRREARVGRPAA